MDPRIAEVYGNKVRLRVCGLCWDGDSLLLVNHAGLTGGDFWAPPGGGVEFGQPLPHNLEREFLEETGLIVSTGRFLFGCEHLRTPLHAVELFFEVAITGGRLITGTDPELNVLKEVRFFSPDQVRALQTAESHGIFRLATSPADFDRLGGFYRI